MSKLKVWLVTPFSPLPGEGWGGVKTHAEYLAKLLLELGADLTVILPEGISRPGIAPAGFTVVSVPCAAQPHTAEWRAAMRDTAEALLRQAVPALVISEGYYAAGCENALKRAGVPLAAFVHNFHLVHFYKIFSEVDGPGTLARYILKSAPLIAFKMVTAELPFLRRADAVLSVSERNASLLSRFYRIPESRLHVLHNWVNTAVFRPEPGLREKERGRLGLSPGQTCFLAAGSLWRPKGFHVAIEAFKRLAERDPGAVLMLAGEGPEEKSLRALAGPELLRGGRIKFLGRVLLSELPSAYNAADIFLMPSIHPEGLAYTLIEAMACGLPAIATALGGNVETLGDCGVLIPPSDVEQLAVAMRRLASDKERRAAMGLSSAARASEMFSSGAAAGKLAEIFKALTGLKTEI